METKAKKCRGLGKAKDFKGCGKLTKHRKYGLGLMCGCYPEWLYNTPKGLIEVEKASLKVSKPRKDFEKAKEVKKNRSTLSAEIEKTQRLVNKYVRLRDYGKPCISQNIMFQKDQEAGHLYSKNTHSAIRFDLDNIHGQSVYANRFKEGDFDNYLSNLPNRIGKERTEALKIRAEECKRSVKKWTISELKEIQENIKELTINLKQ